MLYHGQNFCPNCGSEWVDYRLTPKKITSEITDKYFATDNRFLTTLLHLFRYPENVINGYIVGQRKKYVNPASFYFISLTLVGLQFFLMKNLSPELLGFTDSVDQSSVNSYFDFFYDYLGLFTTVLIPAYAITGLIVFLDIKKYNFAEHMIFYIYVFGLSNIVFALFTPFYILLKIPYSIVSLALIPFSLIQITWYYKRCFKLSMGTTILKAILGVLVNGIIQVFYVLILVVLIVGVVYFTKPELLTNIKIA